MTVWEQVDVLALAADPATQRAAEGLARPDRWLESGAGGGLWGRCQGSGRTPYATVVDPGPPTAFTCTCPSRKLPCKHALALMLLWSQGRLPTAVAPAYAAEWLAKRAARSTGAKAPERPAGELADPAAATQRAAARAERVTGGLDELDQWLRDQLRGGLAGLERAGYRPFETIAARMIDAQAPGVASLLRAIPGEITGEGWPGRVLDQLAGLHLLVQAHRRLGQLDPGLAATVRSRIGYPVAKDEVLAGPGVSDHWLAVGMVDTVEYRLETRRVWLYGTGSGRWAMLLSFAPPGGTLPTDVVAGHRLNATVHFYPGAGQFRALVGVRTTVVTSPRFPTPRGLSEIQDEFATLLAADPWATRMPAVVRAIPRPASGGEPWLLTDESGLTCPVTGLAGDPWVLLACSTGDPIGLFGELSPRGFRPLSLLPDDRGAQFATALVSRAA